MKTKNILIIGGAVVVAIAYFFLNKSKNKKNIVVDNLTSETNIDSKSNNNVLPIIDSELFTATNDSYGQNYWRPDADTQRS
jgi:hypothetical protein